MAMTPDLESPTKHLNGSSHSQDSNRNGEVCNGYSEKKHKDKHKEKHKDKDRHKHKSHKHDKDRDRNREKEKEKSHKSSNSNSSPEKDRSKYEKVHADKSPEKLKYEGSSNSSKDRDNSSKDSKHHKSKHKEKHRDKDREKDRNKERDRDKDREKKSSSSSDKHKEQVDIKLEPQVIKAEPATPVKPEFPSSMASVESDDDDDIPLGQRKLVSSFNKQVTQKIKDEEESDDDVPLSARKKSVDAVSKKRKPQSDSDDDDKPLIQRKKVKTESTKSKVKKRARSESDDSDGDYNKKKSKSKPRATSKGSAAPNAAPKKGRKAKEEEEEVWRWWEEAPRDDGVKWNFLEHKGPVFAPAYEPLPKGIQLRYNGKPIKLAQDAEEVAGFYSRFIEHDYTTKEKFNTNFFKDWRKTMTKQEREVITDLSKCDFADINNYYKMKSEERKAMSKEGKLKIKEENEEIQKLHGTCVLDGHKEKIGNFRIEPPGLFRGRGDHPKMGMLKRRVIPEDVTINCSKNSKIPPPPAGHKWKEVKHDNTVTWLACWTENVQGQSKYVMLNPTSRLKGEKDWMKYEKARELAKKIDKIRENYRNDFKSKEMRVRQRAVAMYFIDKLALRAGNEKDEDQADTVGCCSLRFEHIQLHDEKDGQENVVTFDFLGKDSIRYFNEVPVEKRVFKNLKIFMDNKKPGDDLFDRLNTLILNKHLSELMDGLTAKVFRTYNASHTLQQQLDELTPKNGTPAEKILAYNRANRAVAILCNHQRAAPKSHEKSMENLVNKIDIKKDEIKKLKKEIKNLNKGSKDHEKKTNALKRLQQQVEKLEMSRTDKEEGKEIALGTSKLNYLDPRITVAWCKKYDVPVEKVYNKTQRAKFRWAIDMADKHYRFD